MNTNEFEYMEKYLPKEHWDNMMFMGTTEDGIYRYKHILTRRYVNIDSEGSFYIYNGHGYDVVSKEDGIRNLLS